MRNVFSDEVPLIILKTEMNTPEKIKYLKPGIWILAVVLAAVACQRHPVPVTTASLLDELTDLDRLTLMTGYEYSTVQYSSYDRRSRKPGSQSWFANEDGFGNEPVPGFEEVLSPPDAEGIGVYLICDVTGPGAILRLWTAGLNGKIRLFLDQAGTPVYEGDAEEFFHNTCAALSQDKSDSCDAGFLRMFDASYFPIPFASGCRMEWTGDIRKIHFYHVGLRLYRSGTPVVSFQPGDIARCAPNLEVIKTVFRNPDSLTVPAAGRTLNSVITIAPGTKKDLFSLKGMQKIDYLSIRITAGDAEQALRKNILTICFDSSSIPQVQAPLGDFFGSAPGLNPFRSLPFSVESDSTLICRFRMPFKSTAKFEIENFSEADLTIRADLHTTGIKWEEGKIMYFMTRWNMDNGMTASNINDPGNTVSDIRYLSARGKGRLVGTAAFINNPSNVPSSWGNWWGEGDEKISVDSDTFPSFFGTGSEDYFNYSWSSDRIFSFAFCGQPRNDGPGNRGYISDFRWHINDDIPFSERIDFTMELSHHGRVPDFSYGRIVYFYALPGTVAGYRKITAENLITAGYKNWMPAAYFGSAGFRFIQAEELLPENSTGMTEEGKLCAGGKIVMWKPEIKGAKLGLQLRADKARENAKIGFTMAHGPDGGDLAVFVNGKKIKIDGRENISLYEPQQQLLRTHFSESLHLNAGMNELLLESESSGKEILNGIDFIWINEP